MMIKAINRTGHGNRDIRFAGRVPGISVLSIINTCNIEATKIGSAYAEG
jgi:hypothetical protein